MNTFNVPLENVLISLAQNLLPARSGHNKILEVVVKMTKKNIDPVYVKVVFWRPNNYMAVSFNGDWHMDNDFRITANHDSTWKFDGFRFFDQVMNEPDEITIPSFKIVEVEYARVDEIQKKLIFKRKTAVV